jgi:transcriptional regulator with XRE-family HTH domain
MGDFICDARKAKNMTQKELAEKLNITDKAVSKWERNISCPDIHTIPMLADILEVSSDELLRFQRQIASSDRPIPAIPGNVSAMITLIFKAIGTAMGVAAITLLILTNVENDSVLIMLALGLSCLGISQVRGK